MSDKVGCVVQENPGTSNTSGPSGLGVGTGARDSTALWIAWMPILLSRYAVASSSGFRGHQESWNAQLSAVGSYNNIRNDVD